MTRLSEIETFALRLKQARIAEKLSMDGLCAKVGGAVSKQAISKYESSKMMPSTEILDALAVALCKDREYFFRPFRFELSEFEISFRKKSGVTKKDEAALKVQIQDKIERYLEVEEILGRDVKVEIPNGSVSISSVNEMRRCAMKLRSEWGLGNNSIVNVSDLLEEKGIKIIRTGASDSFDGLSGIVNGKHYIIVVNERKNHHERMRFTELHEVGHLMFNKFFERSLKSIEKEKLCHAFASEMLLPSEILLEKFSSNRRISFEEVVSLQKKYGISIDAIIYSLWEAKIINDSRYRSYWIRKKMDRNFKDVMEKSRFSEDFIDKYETMVYNALANELISVGKAASLLDCPVTELVRRMDFV